MSDSPSNEEVRALTTQIVAAYVSRNSVTVENLPDLIRDVHSALTSLDTQPVAPPPRPEPAVAVKKSVTPDYIICLEDGRKLKMLKRHLKTAYNMTPEDYRERWDLPADYPMVAPNYANQRSDLAKRIGLGTKARRGRTGARGKGE